MSETELALLIIAIMAGFSDHKDWRFDTTGLRNCGNSASERRLPGSGIFTRANASSTTLPYGN